MMEVYELKLEKFTGPLDKLLELIEDKKMEITEISLAAVTDDFLKYLRNLGKIELSLLADFIVVASRLVLLKSKSLLPGSSLPEEEEDGIRDLERRLRIYKEFKPALKTLAQLWRNQNWEFSRPYFLAGGFGSPAGLVSANAYGVFYPGEKLTLRSISAGFKAVSQSFGGLKLEEEIIRERVVSLEEKIQEIISWLQDGSGDTFGSLARAKAKSEMIVIFLALLHLAKEKLIQLDQESYFSDIMIRKT